MLEIKRFLVLPFLLQCSCYLVAANVPDYFFNFGEDFGDSTLEKTSGAVSPEIDIPVKFPFFFENQQSVYISANGLLSFESPFVGEKDVIALPKAEVKLVAPFWSDVDLSKNNGNVFYRNTTNSTTLAEVSDHVKTRFITSSKFTPSWCLIATWQDVTHSKGDDDTETNTFQAVLATDGRYSFIFFLYAQLDWKRGPSPDRGPRPRVGLNLNDEDTFKVAVSGTSSVDDVLTSSNIDIDGFWLFRVDEKSIISQGCDDDADLLRPSPMIASPRGGTRLLLSGPCLDDSMTLMARIAGEVIPATMVNSYMAEVITPPLYYQGQVTVEFSTDDGQNYDRTATITIVDDHVHLPTVTRVSPDTWHTDGSISMKWDFNDIGQNVDKVNIYFTTLNLNTDGNVVEELYLLKEEEANDGEAYISLVSLPLIPDDQLELVTHGALLIQASTDTSRSGVQLYSDIHVATWFVDAFLREVGYRNRKTLNEDDSAPLLLSSIWNKMADHLRDAEDMDTLREDVNNLLSPRILSILDAVGTMKCEQWSVGRQVPTGLHPPPCTLRQAEADPRWVADPYCWQGIGALCRHNAMHNCVLQYRAGSTGSSQKACYDKNGYILNAMSAVGSTAGYPLHAHPKGLHTLASDSSLVHTKWWQVHHLKEDVEPMLYCCMWARKNKCDQFAMIRPVSKCTDYDFPASGGIGGDPHVQTLDRRWFTFNGVGEYILTRHPDGFQVQVRHVQTGQSSPDVTNDFKASKVQAAAFKANGSDTIEFRVISSRLKMLFNGKPQDLGCCLVLHFKGGAAFLDMSEPQPTSINVTFDSGQNVRAILSGDSLQLIVTVSPTYKGELEGLMGNYDDIPENDFHPRTGDPLDTEATPQQIHANFGEEWRTDESESLFTYPDNTDHASYQILDYEPIFEIDNMAMPSFCDGNVQCAFDYRKTGDEQFAMGTLALVETLDTYYKDFASGRKCPVIDIDHSTGRLSTTNRWVGDVVTITCSKYHNISGPSERTCTHNATWSGPETECIFVDPCIDYGCKNGTCHFRNNEPVCDCTDGYKGTFCDTEAISTVLYIVIGVVGGVFLLAVLVAGCLLLLKFKPAIRHQIPYNGYPYHFSSNDSDSIPVFNRGTMASGHRNYDRELGYNPFSSNRKPKAPYSRHHDSTPPLPPYPHFGALPPKPDWSRSASKDYRGGRPEHRGYENRGYENRGRSDYERGPGRRSERSRGTRRDERDHYRRSNKSTHSSNHSYFHSSYHSSNRSQGSGGDFSGKGKSAGSDTSFKYGTRTGQTETKLFGGY